MAIDETTPLPPLRPPPPLGIPVETLLSIECVTLGAGDVPKGILREFYASVLGMKVVREEDASILFRLLNRSVLLDPQHAGTGHLGLLIRNFTDALILLDQRQIAYTVLHDDSGFSRSAILRDPAGNWIHLVETRPL